MPPLHPHGTYATYNQELLECTWVPTSVPSTGKPQLECPGDTAVMMLHTDVALVTDDAFRSHQILDPRSKILDSRS